MRDAGDRARSTVWFQRRKCKRHDSIAGTKRSATARRDDDELPSARLVGHRSRPGTRGEVRLPQLAARLDVECPNRAVQCRADENDSARRHDRTAKIGGSGKAAHRARGTFQAMPPVLRFTATSEPNGGGVQGSPVGPRMMRRRMRYGVPRMLVYSKSVMPRDASTVLELS